MRTKGWIVALTVVVAMSSVAAARVLDVDEDIPISVGVFVRRDNNRGDSIPLAVTLENGMRGAISYGTFSLDPLPWNGETASLTLVDVYRNGNPGGLLLARPAINAPLDRLSVNHYVLKSGQSLTVKTDLTKWKIKGGWISGRYTATVRVENIATERGHQTVTVLSEPFSFQVHP